MDLAHPPGFSERCVVLCCALMDSANLKKPPITFREIFPELSEKKLREAEYNFRRYLEIALQICREQRDGSRTDVDTASAPLKMKERSNESLED